MRPPPSTVDPGALRADAAARACDLAFTVDLAATPPPAKRSVRLTPEWPRVPYGTSVLRIAPADFTCHWCYANAIGTAADSHRASCTKWLDAKRQACLGSRAIAGHFSSCPKNCSEPTVSAGFPGNTRSTTKPFTGLAAASAAYLRAPRAIAARADRHGHARIRARTSPRRSPPVWPRRRRRFFRGHHQHAGRGLPGAQGEFSAGVVISASHNPYHDNGVKLFAGSGMKFPDEIEEQLETEILRAAQRPAAAAAPPIAVADRALDEDYLAFLRGCVLPGAKLAGMKIVLDCANGAASSWRRRCFARWAPMSSPFTTGPTDATSMPIAVRCIPENLQKRVVESVPRWAWPSTATPTAPCSSAPVGSVIDGDGVLLAAARYMRSAGKLKGGRVVGTTMANLGLERLWQPKVLRSRARRGRPLRARRDAAQRRQSGRRAVRPHHFSRRRHHRRRPAHRAQDGVPGRLCAVRWTSWSPT